MTKPSRRDLMNQRRATASRQEHSWPDLVWAVAVFLVTLVARFGVSSLLSRLPLVRSPALDGLEYLEWARRLAHGDLTWPTLPSHGPGYPFFLAGVFMLVGESLSAVRFVQACLGSLLCVMVYMLGVKCFGRAAGIAGGFLLATYGPLIVVESSVLAEGLFLFLLCAAFVVVLSDVRSVSRAIGAGMLLVLATLVRPTAFVVLPLLVVFLLREPPNARRGLLSAAALLGAFALCLSPLIVANLRRGDSPLLVQAHGGFNLYLGNSPALSGLATSRLGGSWEALEGEAWRHGLRAASQQDRYYEAKLWREIRDRPSAYLSVLGRKAFWLVQGDEVRDTHSYAFFEAMVPALRWLPGFRLLLCLAMPGLWLGASRDSRYLLLLGYVLCFAATGVLFVMGYRYRLPLVPVLAVFAGVTIASAAKHFRDSRRRRLLAILGFCGLIWIVAGLGRHAPSHVFAEEWTMTGMALASEGDLAGAKLAVERALAEDSGSALAWDELGRIAVLQGNWEAGIRAFARALESNPKSQRSLFHRGLALQKLGRVAEAAVDLRRAVELRPDAVPAVEALGEVLVKGGQLDEARQVYRGLLLLVPEHKAAHFALARIGGTTGEFSEALVHARRATEIDPGDANAWLLMAMLATEARDANTAEVALARAEQLAGPATPQVGFARALLQRLQGHPEAAHQTLKALVTTSPTFVPGVRLFLQNAKEIGRAAEAERLVSDSRRANPPRTN